MIVAAAGVKEYGKWPPPSEDPKQPIPTASNEQEPEVLDAVHGSLSRCLLDSTDIVRQGEKELVMECEN
jgi:hypothetical protein